jgi:serine phosphatase RsbU (regulator of sigma subunit)
LSLPACASRLATSAETITIPRPRPATAWSGHGDIAGKGIAAALLMANLQANLRSQCATAAEQPKQFLHSVNQLFFEKFVVGQVP